VSSIDQVVNTSVRSSETGGDVTQTTALLTDRYELTMVEAALRSGRAQLPATFEVFARRLPEGRLWGVFAGLGRLLEALDRFRFGQAQLAWLEENLVVDQATLEWLSSYRFGGNVDAYREGELYTAGSPVLTVEGTFAEAVLLETLVLSILNFDSAVAAAASLITCAAGDRPVIEMGSRRVDPAAAVAAARSAYLGGFASTSNLQAGMRYGIPTAGTASHAFVLAYPSEKEAFAAQVATFGQGTTLLVDTYDIAQGIRNAVAVAGPRLGGIRIDSGDPRTEAPRARALLDELGASATRIVLTGDLDAQTITDLKGVPADSFGVGASVVTGMGAPSAGFVYKLVAIGVAGEPDTEHQMPVAKRSAGKATFGGRKWAWRAVPDGAAEGDEPSRPAASWPGRGWADILTSSPNEPVTGARLLQTRAVEGGVVVDQPSLREVRAFHAEVRASVGPTTALRLDRRTG
jgi:nicotinate phosphoribosyltransferase